MKRHRIVVAVILLATILGGAAWAAQTLSERAAQEVLMGDELALTPDMEAWIDGLKEQPGVWTKTFGRYRLVLVTGGEKPSAGYSVDITELGKSGGSKWIVDVTFSAPGADEMTASVITYPYALVAIRNDGAEIVVRDVTGPEPIELEFTTAK